MSEALLFEKLPDYKPLRESIVSREEVIEDQTIEEEQNFTEVFSWGSDRFGQLGLGDKAKTVNHFQPKACSYSIPIS